MHTTWLTIFAAAERAGDGEWLRAVRCPELLPRLQPCLADGARKKDEQKANKRSFARVSSTRRSDTAALRQRRWRRKGNRLWLLLETQPEPLPARRSNKLKPAQDLPRMCHVAKKCSPSGPQHHDPYNKHHLHLSTSVLGNTTSHLTVVRR